MQRNGKQKKLNFCFEAKSIKSLFSKSKQLILDCDFFVSCGSYPFYSVSQAQFSSRFGATLKENAKRQIEEPFTIMIIQPPMRAR